MSLPGMNSVYRTAMQAADVVHIEWTYTDGSGAVLYDATNSDADTLARKGVATPVADGGTGITSITLPPCDKVRVLCASIEPPVNGTGERITRCGDIDAAAGTANFVMSSDASTLADPVSGSRGRLTLACEYS